MDRELELIALHAIKNVYAGDHENNGSVEFADTVHTYQGRPIQVLAIGGSNEWLDWLWNFLPVSWDGVKICSYLSAWLIYSGTWGCFERLRRILMVVRPLAKILKMTPGQAFVRKKDMPLLLAVHSKSGPTGFYYMMKFGADYCVAACPARGLTRQVFLENTVMIVDPDDPVPKLGRLFFVHPVCERYELTDDPGMSIQDHFIDHVIQELDGPAWSLKNLTNLPNSKILKF